MKILYGSDLVNELRRNCDRIKNRLWIAVPFIGGLDSVKKIIGRQWIDNNEISVKLLADIDEFNNFNSKTVTQFYQQGEIKHLAGLHAKIFITDDTCLITSANLTNTAFTKRHEIGIFLDETNSAKAISIFNSWWKKAEEVDDPNLMVFKSKADSTEDRSDPNTKLASLWSLPDEPREINYWLKPIGVTDYPVTEDRKFDSPTDDLHFSVYPKAVKIDDLLIGYGIGAKRILTIYKVTSEPIEATEEEIAEEEWKERWSWYVKAKNLTVDFGANWVKHSMYASSIVEDYLKIRPEGQITKVGGKTLGGLSYKRDKINLDPDFAKFILGKVTAMNKK